MLIKNELIRFMQTLTGESVEIETRIISDVLATSKLKELRCFGD